MKRWLAQLTIAAYLGALGWGMVTHVMQFGRGSHPAMYYVVWDMFCGWSGWAIRTHVIAEGESGTYYEVTPAPWGEYHPYGNLGRQHYDPWYGFCDDLALNTLRHTKHEPISRILVIEEAWSKKYNAPPEIWKKYSDEPQEKYSYFHIQGTYDGTGLPLSRNTAWLQYQLELAVAKNPRLQNDSRQSRPFVAFGNPNADRAVRASAYFSADRFAPLGN